MVRGLLSFGSVMLAAGLALSAGLHVSGRVDLLGVFRAMPEIDATFQRGFRSDAISRINRVRVPGGVDEVRGDESLQTYLESFVQAHPKPADLELDEVFDALQSRFPGAQYLAANLVTSRNREDLLGKIGGWTAVANPEFDAINTTVFRAGGRLGALAVMSRRIPEFSLHAANEKGGRFHNRCPHCKVIHALELDRDSRTLILSCPHCELPFDVLAVDISGEIRRATDFFEGFTLPGEPVSKEGSEEDRILALWQRIAAHCTYELDQERPSGEEGEVREVWKRPSETWQEATGDCEDTAILLADVLVGAGFDARVAIGWNGNIGQHAWVVVKTAERQYLLETTLQQEVTREDLVEIGEGTDFYRPEQLFDEERIYYTTARPERFGRDYFSESLWKSVPVPPVEALSQR